MVSEVTVNGYIALLLADDEIDTVVRSKQSKKGKDPGQDTPSRAYFLSDLLSQCRSHLLASHSLWLISG